jgi:chromate transporter
MSDNDDKTFELQPATFKEAFKFWLKLGFISFGGPAGQIALMHKELVERRKWIDDESFLHALNFCMLLPGPEAQQLATYNGWKMHGIKGGITAGVFFVLPSVFILLALSYVYARFGNIAEVSAILGGLKAVVVAIVVEAVIKIGKKAFKGWFSVLIAALSFAAIYVFQVPFPLIVLGAGLLGFLYFRFQNSDSKLEEKQSRISDSRFQIPDSRFQIIKIVAVFILLWLIPFFATGFVFGFNNLASRIYLFFTQTAFVTFGGAYAVLAYVNQAVVNSFGWLTTQQAIDGFALAETTPGPLIMVLQNIGFIAGWNNPGETNQTFFAIICALLATYATFLPSFMFIFVGAPYIEKLRGNQNLSSALAGVTAAVVGVILNLAIVFGATVILPNFQMNWFALVLAIVSFLALYLLKLDVLIIILFGGLCGLAKLFLFS